MLETIRTPGPPSAAIKFVVLIGPNMITNDELQAFQYSVDLVVSVSDFANFRPVLRRGVARHQEFYRSSASACGWRGRRKRRLDMARGAE